METERLNKQDDTEKGREEEKAAKEGRGEGGRKEEEMREETKKKCMMLKGSYSNPLRCLINLIKCIAHLLRHGLIA